MAHLLNGMAIGENCLSENVVPTLFDGLQIPPIPLEDYLLRILSFSQCSTENLVTCLAYIDRLINTGGVEKITPYNIHRLVSTALFASAKFYNDGFSLTNSEWMVITGMAKDEVSRLEFHFLECLQYRLHITEESYTIYQNHIISLAVESGL